MSKYDLVITPGLPVNWTIVDGIVLVNPEFLKEVVNLRDGNRSVNGFIEERRGAIEEFINEHDPDILYCKKKVVGIYEALEKNLGFEYRSLLNALINVTAVMQATCTEITYRQGLKDGLKLSSKLSASAEPNYPLW